MSGKDFDGITLHAKGDAFADGTYDLRAVEKVITNYRRIIDHTVPFALGRKTLNNRLKSELQYSTRIEQGSLRLLLEFVWEHRDAIDLFTASTVGSGISLTGVVSMMLDGALGLRRLLRDWLTEDEGSRNIIGSQHAQNIFNLNFTLPLNEAHREGDKITVNPITISIADATKSSVDGLVNIVDGQHVEEIRVSSEKATTVITPADRSIIGSAKEQLSSTMEVIGRLDIVKFNAHSGNLITTNGAYPVTWEDNIRGSIQHNADRQGITFVVRPVIDKNRFKDDPVGLHIIDCYDAQNKLLDK